jgi:hypothetical protein
MFRVVVFAVLFALSVGIEPAHSFINVCGAWGIDLPQGGAASQADNSYTPDIEPTYGSGEDIQPIVAVDITHDNYHTISGRYAGFAKLLRADGVGVKDFSVKFPAHDCADSAEIGVTCAGSHAEYLEALEGVDILVIANATEWISEDEAAVLSGWLSGDLACSEGAHCGDRGLFLIADHERDSDFPEKISSLSAEVGLDWPNYSIGLRGQGASAESSDLCPTDAEITNATRNLIFEVGDYVDASVGQLSADHPIVLGRQDGERIRRVKTFFGSAIVDGPGESILSLSSEDALWWYDEGESGETKGNATGYSQGMAFRHGRGRVYASGEAAMFTVQTNSSERVWGMQEKSIGGEACIDEEECPDNEQYLLNIIHWLDGILEVEDQALIDTDGDGYYDVEDNCSEAANPTQFDGDDDGYGNACDADFNNDGAVGMDDVGALLRGLNTISPVMDLDEDGVVAWSDLFTTYYALGIPPGPSGFVAD